MAFAATICVSFLFLFLAHSTLLHFRVEQACGHPIPARSLIVPLPDKGKFLSFFAALAGLLFLSTGTPTVPRDPAGWTELRHALPALSALVFYPAAAYATYIVRRLEKRPFGGKERLFFLPRKTTHKERFAPLALIAILDFLGYVFM